MEVEDLPNLDRISNLLPNIIQTILTLMPIKDAFRTSILSKSWRYHCLNIPKLSFNDLLDRLADETLPNKCKLLHVIYPILLLHQGPILKFSLTFFRRTSFCEIDQIILYLSRNATTLKEFTLWIYSGDTHKLLPAFFKLQQLTVLELKTCAFQPPVTFQGFSRLVTLSFSNVSISAKVFQRFISSCPLLKSFTLIGKETHFLGCWNSGFVELFECLPLIEHLHMSCYPIKCFATGVIPQKLPTSLVHLKRLDLGYGLCFVREVDFLSALLLVTSSPNIERIILKMEKNSTEVMSQTTMNLIDNQDYSYVLLDHLRVMEITNFTNMKTEMDFVKLILAKSPMLKKINISINEGVDIHDQVKMLKELIQYPRASAKAEIMVN